MPEGGQPVDVRAPGGIDVLNSAVDLNSPAKAVTWKNR
jgi:hypothetical protein